MIVGKLYMTDTTAPVRCVLLTEKALGIQLKHCDINQLNEDKLRTEYQKVNSQRTIPMYIDQDGSKLWDSHAITAYLVSKYGKTDELYPKDLYKRAVVDQRLHFDSGNLFPYLKIIFNGLLKEGWSSIPANVLENVNAQYDFVNKFLEDSKWVAGNNITIADYSILTTIAAIGIFVRIDSKKYANIGRWLKDCESWSYYSAHFEGHSKLKKDVEESLKQKNIVL